MTNVNQAPVSEEQPTHHIRVLGKRSDAEDLAKFLQARFPSTRFFFLQTSEGCDLRVEFGRGKFYERTLLGRFREMASAFALGREKRP
jgi:hypothetical protein